MKTSPQTHNRIFLGILALAIVFLLIGVFVNNTTLMGTGLTLAFGSFVFRVMTYRCPHCGYYLGRRDGTHCPKCGKNIE